MCFVFVRGALSPFSSFWIVKCDLCGVNLMFFFSFFSRSESALNSPTEPDISMAASLTDQPIEVQSLDEARKIIRYIFDYIFIYIFKFIFMDQN